MLEFEQEVSFFTSSSQTRKTPPSSSSEKGEHFHLYFETDDASAAASALKRNGVPLIKDVHETAWGTREFVIKDDQGHTLYFGRTSVDF